MNKNSCLCKFISENADWRKKLTSYPFFIHIKESGNLAIFNYGLTDTDKISLNDETIVARIDFSIPEVQEARGIIINTETCDVVCWPFRKFGNYGESYVDDIDWNSALVEEKVDGSIMKLWYDKRDDVNMWRISTNGVIDAFTCHTQGEYVFGEMFKTAAEKQNLDLDKLDVDYTYIFELVGPYNRVVIEYPELMIYHIGTRNNITGKEIDTNIGIIQPKRYKINSLTACIEAAKHLNTVDTENRFDVKNEGFVVVDKNFNRIKIKSPEYVAVHHAFNNGVLGKRKVVMMILENEDEEYLTYFPQHKERFEKIKSNMDKLSEYIKDYCYAAEAYAKTTNISRKDFSILLSKDNLFTYGIAHVFDGKNILQLSKDISIRGWLNWMKQIDSYDFEAKNPAITKIMKEINLQRNVQKEI